MAVHLTTLSPAQYVTDTSDKYVMTSVKNVSGVAPTSSEYEQPEAHKELKSVVLWMQYYIVPAIFTFGILGNTASFVVSPPVVVVVGGGGGVCVPFWLS